MIKVLFYWVLNNTLYSSLFWKLLVLYYTIKISIVFVRRFIVAKTFPALIKKRRAVCEKSFQYEVSTDDISHGLKDQILSADIHGLRELIWTGKVSAEQVLKFYFSRSKTIGRELGAAIEANFEQALALAKAADQRIRTQDRATLPPLLGIPFSVKENYLMKGFMITHGLEPRIGNPKSICNTTSPLIEHFISQGGIPFVRSNIPQILMAYESDNPIYGKVLNPHNHKRISGGSSGGEGALVASGCSPFGMGNDIGGSIRIPALLCGVFGFKPSSSRMEINGQLSPININCEELLFQDYIRVVNGPLARSVGDLKLITKLMCDPKISREVSSSLPPLLWREEAATLPKKKLNIGYFDSIDEVFETSTANKRAVHLVVEALRKEGHNLIKLEPKFMSEILCRTIQIFLSDGSIRDNISFSNGVTMIPAYSLLQIAYYLPRWLKKTLAWVLKMIGKERLGLVIGSSMEIPTSAMFVEANTQQALTRDFLEQLLAQDIHHLISPGMGLPAPKHFTTGYLLPNAIYTLMFNFYGLPTGVLPITRVRKDEQEYTSKHDDPATQTAKDCMVDSENLPVGVQVSALPFRDEECLALMEHIETIMKLKPLLKL